MVKCTLDYYVLNSFDLIIIHVQIYRVIFASEYEISFLQIKEFPIYCISNCIKTDKFEYLCICFHAVAVTVMI